jgi:hypothetical protein
MKVILEFDVNKLVSRPEFRINIFVEFNYLLIVLSFGDVWGLDEKRNPVVSAIAIKVGCMEVISINEISSAFVNEDNDVNLILCINELSDSLVDQSDESSLKAEGRVSTNNFVESKPGKLTQSILTGFFESRETAEIFNFLPIFKRFSISIEYFLINFE